MVDTATLSPEKQAEFEKDKRESNRRYDAAFDEVLSHTTEAEWSTFWAAFGEIGAAIQRSTQQLSTTSSGVGFTNPILHEADRAVSRIRTLKQTRSGSNLSELDADNIGAVEVEEWDESEHHDNQAQRACL